MLAWYSRRAVMSSSDPQRPDSELAADVLAEALFNLSVVKDEDSLFQDLSERYRSNLDFRQEAFCLQRFVYLAASVALALTHEQARQPRSYHAIKALKHLVTQEAVHRPGFSTEKKLDDTIEEAASKLHDLIFTDPELKPGYSFDWAREWIKDCGVDEVNPAVLFKFAHTWRNQYLALARGIRETRII